MDCSKTYAWNPEDYQKYSSAQYGWARELIDKIGLQGNESVLDVGCGDGRITALISALLPNGTILGLDSSEKMIGLARQGFPSTQYPNLSFVVGNAAQLTFENRFDVIFSNAALHWIKDQSAVLKGIERSLNKSGRLLFQMAGKGNAEEIVVIADGLRNSAKWGSCFHDFHFPYRFCSDEEYTRWLAEAGLIPKRVELFTRDMAHKGKEGLAGWIRTTWMPYTENIPENRRTEFINDIVDAYVEEHPIDSLGMIHVTAIRLEVEARKP